LRNITMPTEKINNWVEAETNDFNKRLERLKRGFSFLAMEQDLEGGPNVGTLLMGANMSFGPAVKLVADLSTDPDHAHDRDARKPLPTRAMSRTVPTARFEVEFGVRARLVVARPLPSPSAASKFALFEEMLRSEAVPVEMASCPEPLTEAAVAPAATARLAWPALGPEVMIVAVCTPVARSMAFKRSATVPD